MKRTAIFLAPLLAVAAAPLPAADPQLLNMVMPDAQVMAGVNVEQARTTPFGQWVLGQMQANDQHMQDMATLVGFDPRRDVRELLLASPGSGDPQIGLALARGNFDVTKIAAAARSAGAIVENYKGATLISEPKRKGAFAFPDSTTVVAGQPDLVKAAIDRRSAASGIGPTLAVKVNQLSTSQDAWAVSLVPPSTLRPPAHGPDVGPLGNAEVLQNILAANCGVKFGSNIVLTAEAQAATPQDATGFAGVLQFLANLAQSQSQQNPDVAAMVKALKVTTEGAVVKVSFSLPQSQFEQLVKPRAKVIRKAAVRQ
jgi:hypothetical protein